MLYTQIGCVAVARRIFGVFVAFFHSLWLKRHRNENLAQYHPRLFHSFIHIMRFLLVTSSFFRFAPLTHSLLSNVDHRRHEWNETTMFINFLHVTKRLFRDYRQRAHIILYFIPTIVEHGGASLILNKENGLSITNKQQRTQRTNRGKQKHHHHNWWSGRYLNSKQKMNAINKKKIDFNLDMSEDEIYTHEIQTQTHKHKTLSHT